MLINKLFGVAEISIPKVYREILNSLIGKCILRI